MVNQEPVLHGSSNVPVSGLANDDQIKKSEQRSDFEKARRDDERRHLARISRLFRAPQGWPWSRKDIFSLGEIPFRIDGQNCYLPNPFQLRCFSCTVPRPSPGVSSGSAMGLWMSRRIERTYTIVIIWHQFTFVLHHFVFVLVFIYNKVDNSSLCIQCTSLKCDHEHPRWYWGSC